MIRRMMMAGLNNNRGGGGFSQSWSIDLGGQYAPHPEEEGVIWNDFHPTEEQYSEPNGLTVSDLLNESGESTVLSLTNVSTFNGASSGFADYTSEVPVYPIVAVNSGLSFSAETTMRIGGCNIAKTYDVVMLSVDTTPSVATSITSGIQSDEVTATNNYPADGADRYDNTALLKLINVVPDGSGNIDFALNKTGSYYQTVANLMIIREHL